MPRCRHFTLASRHHSNTTKPRYARQRAPIQTPITKAPNPPSPSISLKVFALLHCNSLPRFLTNAQFFHQNPKINKLKKQNTKLILPALIVWRACAKRCVCGREVNVADKPCVARYAVCGRASQDVAGVRRAMLCVGVAGVCVKRCVCGREARSRVVCGGRGDVCVKRCVWGKTLGV